jgi:WD40 repeat protein
LLGADRFLVFLDTNPLQVWDFTAEAKRLEVPKRFATKGTQVDATRGRLLVLGADGKSVLSWDMARQKRGPVLVRWPEPVRDTWRNAFRLSADGRTLAVAAKRGQVIFRDVPSGAEIGRMPPRNDWVAATFLSPDGRTLCSASPRWRLWDVPAGTVRCDLWPHPLAFHPTAPVCAVSLHAGLALVRVQTGEAIRSFDFGLGEARYVSFSPDGLTCAVGGSNKRFAVFDVGF